MREQDVVGLCKALGDANRLRIVTLLGGGEKCACKLLEELSITQPTLSHHMGILQECGLVHARKEGKWSHYSLDKETFAAFGDYLEQLEEKER